MGMTLDHQPLAAFRWDKQGRECERRQGNGLVNRYDYDNLSRLTHHQIFHGFDFDSQRSPTPLWQQDYGYQADNQLSQIRGNAAREYQYDAIGQLTSEGKPEHHQTHHAQPLAMLHYDATGNLLSDTKNHIAKGNRLTFFGDKHFEYDRFGNLIAEKRGKNHRLVTHYEYDCRHRLIKVIKPTGLIITYTYDAFNRRTSKTVEGKTTEFIWQDHKLIAECADNDKFWRSYIYEPDSHRPLAQILGKAGQSEKLKTYWYQNNYLGTPHRLTDSLGETVYECEYSAYGEIIHEHWPQAENNIKPINPLRFQGQYYDEETGLHYNLNRYYAPNLGRFITQDPAKLYGGLNSYQYCFNPIIWIDPLGLLAGLGSHAPYDPHLVRKQLEELYGPGNVVSNTVPLPNNKNVKLRGQRHPKSKIVFDNRGLGIFDDIARYDTVLPSAEFYNKSYRGQMKMATEDLRRAIQRGEVNPGIFTPEQLKAINAGKSKIPDYIWHHHQHRARMQLVPDDKHLETGHIGGEALSKGK